MGDIKWIIDGTIDDKPPPPPQTLPLNCFNQNLTKSLHSYHKIIMAIVGRLVSNPLN